MANRRDRILEVAAHRFAQFGFEATTVRQIADDVNILSGSLYHHFVTKEEMLHEIVRNEVLRMRDHAKRIARVSADAELRLVALILSDIGEFTANPEVHAILYNERLYFRRSDDFAYVVKAKKDAYRAWKAIISDGVRDGLFRSDTDLYLTISTILRMLSTGAAWYRSEEGSGVDVFNSYTIDKLTDFYLDFILRAIRVPSRVAAPIPRKAAEELARPEGIKEAKK